VTVFLTTHNLAEAEKLCQQVAVVRDGKLLAVGSLDQLRAQAGGPRIEITGKHFSSAALELLRSRREVADFDLRDGHLTIHLKEVVESAPLVSLLIGAGAQVEEVHKGQASLEDTFLALMEEDETGNEQEN
jgi:ABC-2 type transport system ATP-binding protein